MAVASQPAVLRRRVCVRGIVQGVGFRPFVYNLAQANGLSGFVLNLVSSPGAGTTALLERLLTDLRTSHRVAALVGDLATENDAARLARSGAPVLKHRETSCSKSALVVRGGTLDGHDHFSICGADLVRGFVTDSKAERVETWRNIHLKFAGEERVHDLLIDFRHQYGFNFCGFRLHNFVRFFTIINPGSAINPRMLHAIRTESKVDGLRVNRESQNERAGSG